MLQNAMFFEIVIQGLVTRLFTDIAIVNVDVA